MKVVIFCGGLGIRMGEESMRTPKPMISIGSRPILWHIMQYYAAWGHTDFVLCLGHRGHAIKEYFLRYEEALFSDFRLEGHGASSRMELLSPETPDWQITFADTGIRSTIAERLQAVSRYLGDDDVFMVTYGDGLTDAPVNDLIEAHRRSGRIVQFLAVRPPVPFHAVRFDDQGIVHELVEMNRSDLWINGGFMVCKRELIDHIEHGDELVVETFGRLMERREVVAYPYRGFFRPMDTMKDRQYLEALYESGTAPWIAEHVHQALPVER